jgi:hypothetical protein
MTEDVFQPGIVPMTSYDSRKTHDDAHSPAYKALAKAQKEGQLRKFTIGRRVFVSKTEADAYLLSLAAAKVKAEVGSRCGVSLDERLRALEQTVTDLCVQLGFVGRS